MAKKPLRRRGQVCGLDPVRCPHCPACLQDTREGRHLEGCIHTPICVACNDTGRNSKGRLCVPCLVRAEKEQAKPPSLFD